MCKRKKEKKKSCQKWYKPWIKITDFNSGSGIGCKLKILISDCNASYLSNGSNLSLMVLKKWKSQPFFTER